VTAAATHLKALFMIRGARLCFALLALIMMVLSLLPLVTGIGYEFSLCACVCFGFLGMVPGSLSSQLPLNPTGKIATAALFCFTAMVPAMLLSSVRAFPCHPFLLSHFFFVLVPPSVFISTALGLLLRTLFHTKRALMASGLVAILATAPSTLYTILFGPQVFAFNHLIGYIPGPLYDTELRLPISLLWFRLGSMALFGFLVALIHRNKSGSVLMLVILTLIEYHGDEFGFRTTQSTLEKRLSVVQKSKRLVLHHEPMSESASKIVFDDFQFRFFQLEQFFGGSESEVHIWYYPSAELKAQWVGAAHTQFAKPWRHEVHINAMAFPHPVVKHELVHALAAPWGNGFFKVTSEWGGIILHTGIIEGLAVAADNPVDELTLHEWSAAMKRNKMLPNLRQSLSPRGFFFANASRAYTSAGSFLRFLVEKNGSSPMKQLYKNGDFKSAYSRDLDSLVSEWELFLDTVPLENSQVNLAANRFRGGSVFDAPCAREVELLRDEMGHVGAAQGIEMSSRCLYLQPENPTFIIEHIQRLRSVNRDADAAKAIEQFLKRFEGDVSAWSQAALLESEHLLSEKKSDDAKVLLEKIVASGAQPSIQRTATMRLAGFNMSPGSRDAVDIWFSRQPDSVRFSVMQVAAAADSQNALLPYLLARQWHRDANWKGALTHLNRSLELGLPEVFEVEAERLKAECLMQLSECVALELFVPKSARVQRLKRDQLARCQFIESESALRH
jgi:hypothetical protein